MDARPPVIALMGPTASGKTALSLELAERYHGEIVSVDSVLVYRRLDIGSAKPSAEEQARVPHHMLDMREPWQPCSAAEFAEQAAQAIAAIHARGKIAILAGGTGLYFRALLDGLAQMPESDAATRAQIAAQAAQQGWPALHAQLRAIDPIAAARIHATDSQRIGRALEVFQISGKPISYWQQHGHAQRKNPFRTLKLVLCPATRALLHARIAARFDAMLAAGFLDEVAQLRALPQLATHPAPLDLPALRAVGYRQAWEYLDGLIAADALRERGIFATRQLAKRQLTWLQGQYAARWFDPLTQQTSIDKAVRQFLPR